MAGRQLNFAIKGELYEKTFDSIASGFLSIVRTPRGPDDYGIDAFCHIRFPLDAISSTVGGTFAVQVRGPGADLQFGGVVNGQWKSYEIEWLRSLAVPLYMARVSDDCVRIDLYSLWPISIVLAQSRTPFRIICQCDEPESDPQMLRSRSAGVFEGSQPSHSLNVLAVEVLRQSLHRTFEGQATGDLAQIDVLFGTALLFTA